MAVITVDDAQVAVTLTRFEHVFGLLGDLSVARTAVVAVDVVAAGDDPLRHVPGWRAPGLAWPGRIKVGTWRGGGDRWFVVVRAGLPAVRLRFAGHRYTGALVGIADAAGVAAALTPGAR
jgi:hypothetical protein